MPGALIVISGPSGVGKSTIVEHLIDRLGAKRSISATTRAKSDQEEDGRDYYFVSDSEFRDMIDADELLEWAKYLGNYYGTPKKSVFPVLERGENIILEIEVEGGKQVADRFPDAIMIYLLPPDPWALALQNRLKGRLRDDSGQIERRLANAKREIDQARTAGVYRYWIVNDQVDRAVGEIVNIVSVRSS